VRCVLSDLVRRHVTAAGSPLDCTWSLSPQVVIRPERFGALLYHFGTRRLSFVKDKRLLAVVERLDESSSARVACEAAGVAVDELPAFERALAQLADSDMLRLCRHDG
jgi:mycofactocin biosynthesis protein MftB